MEKIFEESDFLLTVDNVASLVFNSAKLTVDNSEVKAVELTTLVAALLRPGIYDSIERAQEKGVPAGTFIIIDDPETPEYEFNIQIVPAYSPRVKGDGEGDVKPLG